ncbi:TonB-dependent hemoglobin/transferrin/lactoferrin family receptor [Dokdonella soli]|uniref:TonB-dependent hemoglobin/transferrin/lactoferrin family receptor n=1 Tax=Dokdonella soli TaxID=529810 RepID=A0ABP3TLD8_9GAMM
MQKEIHAGIAVMLLATGAHADEPNPLDLPIFDELDRIVVTATLNERAQKDVASEVSVIDAAEIDQRQVQGIGDLVRYEPGVSATGSDVGGGRFGTSGISIRGLGGNRVRIELDGIAIPDSFGIGSFSSAGRDVVDVDALKRVEIVRGAASSLYGSDALGGVVSYVTKDPADYLGKEGGQFASGKLLYDSTNRGSAVTGTWAGGDARNGVVLVATRRDGAATNNKGDVDSADSTRTRPNPQDTTSDALLAKYVHTATSGRVDHVTIDGDRGDVDTNVLTGRSYSPLTRARTTSLRGDDNRQRVRFSFDQSIPLTNSFADGLDWKAYVQHSEIDQDTFEDRMTIGNAGPVNPKQRFRRFTFDQRVFGAEAIARKATTTGAIEHALTYGVDLSRTHTAEQRDGWQRDVTTGAITHVVPPDAFPVRDFPVTGTTTAAAFGQDELRLAGGKLSLIPALRVDYYKLDPKSDAIFEAGNPGVTPAGLDSTSWSPKFGAIWRFNDAVSAFAQYAHGFRAPPYSDVNIGFTNLAFGYTSLPNPHLKPETSNGLEIGLRANGALGWFSVSAYENRYRDFIESQSFVGVDPQSGLMLFQSINLGRVKIRGTEARYGLNLGALAPALDGWSLKGSLAIARGDDEIVHTSLTRIDPSRAVAGLAFDRERWGAELVGSFVACKDRLPAPAVSQDPSAPPPTPLFKAPGYSTFDLYAHWQPLPKLEVFGALTNLGDRRYWNWGAVGGFAESRTVDLYSAPGRAVRVGVRATF